MASRLQFRRDSSANWASANPVLAEGEIGLDLTLNAFKIGDGVTAWNSLSFREFSGVVPSLQLDALTSDLPAAPTGFMRLYARFVAGRTMAKIVGPSGLDTSLQPLMARNKIGIWTPQGNSTGVPGVFGYAAPTGLGTNTARNVAATNIFTLARRLGYVSAATAASLAGHYQTIAQIIVGNGTFGGFFKVVRFGISDAAAVAGARMCVGVSSLVAAPTNVEPSTLVNHVGVGHGAADTNLKLFYGGSVAQAPIDLGANFPISGLNTDLYELALFSPPGVNGKVYYEVTRVNTGHVAVGELNSSGGVALPASTTLLAYQRAWRCNNATALAVGIDIISDYVETDT